MEATVSPAADPPRTPTKSPLKKKKKKGTPQKGQKKAEPKRKRGKSDRDKLVERLMYQNMKIWEMLEKHGIMQNPKDLTNLEKFIKQGSRTALRQAVDTQRTLGLLDLEREAIQRESERQQMTIEEGRTYRQEAHAIWIKSEAILAKDEAITERSRRLEEEHTALRNDVEANLKEVRELKKYWSARGEELMRKMLAHQKSTESYKQIMAETRTLKCDACYAKLLEAAPPQ